MELHTDPRQRVVLYPESATWVASPEPGVSRRMLERQGGEVARATTVVRYEPRSRFPGHVHGGGEELYILEGTFSDEHGHYPAGTYVRNPPGSRHAPWSDTGCLLLGKLRQFQPGDSRHCVIDTRAAVWSDTTVAGITSLELHRFAHEEVTLVRFAPGAHAPVKESPGGIEMFVIEGELIDEHGVYPAGTWVRSPPGHRHTPSSPTGCLLYVKRGHLLVRDMPPA